MSVLIGIIEDDETLRSTIIDYISIRGYALVFACGNPGAIQNEADTPERPDVILLDEHLGSASGISSLQEIRKIFPATRIIIMTGDTTQELIIRAIENGAAGFIYKPFSLKQMDEAINSLMETGSYLHPVSATKLISTIQKGKETERNTLQKLSAKELEVAELLMVGKSYKEIALLLNKSFHTINYHIKNMYVKFDVNSKTELVYMLNKKNKR